jgi:ABC-type transport system involved in cytochrome c biogenesis permease subunit
VLGFWPTIARLVFPSSRGADSSAAAMSARAAAPSSLQMLGALDQCNLVVLQLAFWMLGLGICFGAIWADQSWGRPWGWDPKETFALVTWIVYMIAVHVRVATTDKAWWTAALGVIGFFIMLFNWIGVNFWLVGLHSYA